MDDRVISGDPSGFLGPIALLPFSITALLMGVLLLDLAVQAVHVANLSRGGVASRKKRPLVSSEVKI